MSNAYISVINLCLVCLISAGDAKGPLNDDLVEIVKTDLRRNNEDYKDIKNGNNLTLNDKKANGLKSYRRINTDTSDYNYDYIDKARPKAVEVVSNATVKTTNTVRGEPLQHIKIMNEKLPKKVNKMFDQNTATLPIANKSPVKPENLSEPIKTDRGMEIPKFVNKNKIQKFKKFMKKNSGLLKDFLSSKMEIQMQKTTSRNQLRQNEFDLDKLGQSMEVGHEAGGAAVRNFDKYQKNDHITLPSTEMLDMAPARGGRIHKQRVKGRLCHRHVLVPEGPKYDSQGKWYLPAHKLIVDRPYNVTHRPKLMLPRCCNCCKKSVLGCE